MASMSEPIPKVERPWRSDPITRLVSLVPFGLALYLDLMYKPLSGMGIFSKPPELIGIPAGVWMQAAFLALAAVGAFVVWTTKSRMKGAIAFVLCIPIAIVGIVMTPAVVLIMQNLA